MLGSQLYGRCHERHKSRFPNNFFFEHNTHYQLKHSNKFNQEFPSGSKLPVRSEPMMSVASQNSSSELVRNDVASLEESNVVFQSNLFSLYSLLLPSPLSHHNDFTPHYHGQVTPQKQFGVKVSWTYKKVTIPERPMIIFSIPLSGGQVPQLYNMVERE